MGGQQSAHWDPPKDDKGLLLCLGGSQCALCCPSIILCVGVLVSYICGIVFRTKAKSCDADLLSWSLGLLIARPICSLVAYCCCWLPLWICLHALCGTSGSTRATGDSEDDSDI